MRARNTTGRDTEQTIMALARTQHGVATRAQLLAAGITTNQVDRRLRGHRLRSLQRGVYLVGPLTAPLTREMSAVLACGESAVLSHRSAAALWQLVRDGGDACASRRTRDAVDVTVPRAARRHRPGVHLHRMQLRDDEVTTFEAMPVTTPARTLFDLAATLAERDLERAVAEALALRLTTPSRLETLVRRYERRAGAGRLRALLGSGPQPALTRSAAEESFLTLIRKAQLPEPEVNVGLHGHEVDFFWRAQRLVVEIDGFAFHSSRRSFDSDRRRDAVLAAAGLRVMRVTWQQIDDEPEALLVRLAQALARAD